MSSNWRGIVQFREEEDQRPLWQRRSSPRSPLTAVSAEWSSESGPGTNTGSSGGSRSSSMDDDYRYDHRSTAPRTIRHMSPVLVNRYGVGGRNGKMDEPNLGVTTVGRSSSFKESINVVSPATPISSGYRRNGSPYNARYYQPISNRSNPTEHHLTADYVPSWRPDRRFSTPAVPRIRGSVSRSPSPRFINKKGGQQSFEYFRHRAASLPASNACLNAAAAASGTAVKKRHRRLEQDQWPQTRSPSRVEQRFLELSESADYDKIRSFVIGTKGELVERGFCYRHRSETGSSSSPGSTGPTGSPNDDTAQSPIPTSSNMENMDEKPGPAAQPSNPRYSVLVIGAPTVGKTSLISTLNKCQELESDEIITPGAVASPGVPTVVPVLICGEEVHLEFYEFSLADEAVWTRMVWQAIVVVYSVSDKPSFSAAADALYKLRAENGKAGRLKTGNDYGDGQPMPIILVGNKIDLERHRQVLDQDGIELSKSYDCGFVDVSVELNHRVEDVMNQVMNEIWRCTVSAFRQRQMKTQDGPILQGSMDEDIGEKKPKRFSLRFTKPKPTEGNQSRSTRASSLYVLSLGVHPSSLYGTTNAVSGPTNNGGTGLLGRLFGRRAVQSCEDLFSRLLRG